MLHFTTTWVEVKGTEIFLLPPSYETHLLSSFSTRRLFVLVVISFSLAPLSSPSSSPDSNSNLSFQFTPGMGSGSSRLGSDRSSNPSRLNRTKRKLSSILLCGHTRNSNSPSSALELESPTSSIENLPPASIESITSAGVSSSFFDSEPVCTSSKTSESEPESCNSSAKNIAMSPINSSEDKASTSYAGQPSQEPVSGNNGSESESALPINEGAPVNVNPITVSTEENLDSDSGRNQNDIVRNSDSNTRALLVLSDSFLSLRIFGSGITDSGSGVLPSDVEPDVMSGRILLMDTGNVLSSGVSEISSREGRRNSGRLFGDTSARRGSRRDSGFPAIFFTAGLDDDRWLLDISGRENGYLTNHGRNEERRRFRSQMSERGLGGVDERENRTRFCASGLHRDGTCSCGGSSFLGEETGSFGSISRVVLLAQALSEVLDEIHRQPLSLSMPMLSLPAPESVVDSFLLKSHKKIDASETGPNYVQQCYICLVDYEEGDEIRVLPCRHEYHAPCVDKWLKEVNGVCPVCRCNVCDTPAAAEGQVSNSELAA
ncbi:unnamed protein product [Lactuca saligna]|uniref:RING-type domain-containing protein n=1 Tax=Lactuca saligna TaxID=75948 RepID=A0AA35ZGW7_LACSI|nr:unnamed protein product [Lactuca saligna]